MHPVAPRQLMFDQLTPPALRDRSTAYVRRARLLGVSLAFGPGMGIIMCALLVLINRHNAAHVWPIVIADLFFWALLAFYWFRGHFSATAHATMLIFNGLIVYFAWLWGVGAPMTVWAVASTVFCMYLLETKRSIIHVGLLLLGLAIISFGELSGYSVPENLDAGTEAAMALASALLALVFTIMVTAEVRFLYERAEQLLDQEARTDVLTGLSNRRHFFDIAKREERVAGKEGWGMAVLLIDMDRFKQINDTWGHAAGDKALKAVADILKRTVPRFIGTPARVAGDEFVVLLSHSEIAECTDLANRIREAVSLTRVYGRSGQTINLSVSIGVAEYLPVQGETIDEGLARADRLLYKAKDQGRNTVIEDDRLRIVGAA